MTNCANCGNNLESDASFCGNCGAPVAAGCPNCGRENPPDHNFCAGCGQALATTPAEAPATDPGERRFVSVLFADLVGFTSFSESRDPEEVRSMLTLYFERAQEVIERFGGEIDKYIGDAVTAFWGAHRALEDDAERAVRAALELTDAVAALGAEIGIPNLQLRAGVLSGEASVGSGGNETGLVLGDIVNTASRLQSAAEPGAVFVGASTQQLTSGAIRYEHAGTFEMKGKSETVEAWKAIAVTAQRGGAGKWEVLEPPFVGRENELRLLKDQLHATTSAGTARLVSIIGEAGIGKSRLGWELRKYVDGITEVIRWHQGRSPAYGEAVTFWALTEMVRSRAGIAETEDPLKARNALRACVAEYVSDPEEQNWMETRLAGLLGLADMPTGNRDELYAALRGFFQRVAATSTTLLLFEDLHWADDGQLEFIEELVEMSPNHPILVVTLARPELLDRHPGWGSARRNFISLHLGPLVETEMHALVTGMAPGIPDQTAGLITERSGGVPLYAVEYVRTMISSRELVQEGDQFRQVDDEADITLPDSLHAVIGARLDRLSDLHRSIIQDASVLGQSFTLEGLTALTGSGRQELEPELRDLARHELLRYESDPRSPERGQYQFVQSVIREVAYGRIALADRKDRHVTVAEYFQEQAPVETAAVIANHYMSAFTASPDDDLADRARNALTQAATRAEELKSFTQAVGLLEQALEVPGTDAQRAAIWSQAVVPSGELFHHDDALRYARNAYDWYAEHGSVEEQTKAARVFGMATLTADDPIGTVELLKDQFDQNRIHEPEMLQVGAVLANAYMRAQSQAEGAEVGRLVVMAAEAAGDMPTLIDALNSRGSSLSIGLGRRTEGIALLRESLRLAEREGLPVATLRAINNLLVADISDGYQASGDLYMRGYELSQRVQYGALTVRLATSYAMQHFHEGRPAEAIEMLKDTDTGEESELDIYMQGIASFYRWAMAGNDADMARHVQLLQLGIDGNEPQYKASAYSNLSAALDFQGEYEQAWETAHEVKIPGVFQEHLHHATAAAMRLRDIDKLRQVPHFIESLAGRRIDAIASTAEAGLELLEGNADRAAALFVELVQRWDDIEGPFYGNYWRTVFADVMPDRPEATEAAAEAHRWYSEAGLNGFLKLNEKLWSQHLGQSAVAG